jgi:tRNA-modifying protein YgfZ
MDNYSVNLNHRELLVVSGEDSESFLQGQLSCDLSDLSKLDSCLGCLCDNKGRVVASFTLWKIADVFYLEIETGVAAIAEQHLKKYSVFYKSEITINNEAFYRTGLIGPSALKELENLFPELPRSENQVTVSGANFLRLTDAKNQRYELWQGKNSESELSLTQGELENWIILDQEQGLYRLKFEDSALYTPQELNYDLLGHISFTKGCYTGQEIVARMHYRGKAKKRLYLLQVNADSIPEKNMKIVLTDNKVIGEIISIATITKNQFQVQAIAKESINQAITIEKLNKSEIKLISS